MSRNIQNEAESFAKTYGQSWDTPDASSLKHHTTVANKAGRCYTPGCMILTNGEKSYFEVSLASRMACFTSLIIHTDTRCGGGTYRR